MTAQNNTASEQPFRIVFTGKRQPGWDEESAASALAALLKTDAAKAVRYISGKPMILKKPLTADKARAYQRKLENAGVVCKIKDISEKKAPETVPPPVAEKTAEKAPEPETAEKSPHKDLPENFQEMDASEAIRVMLSQKGHNDLLHAAQPGGVETSAEKTHYIDIQTNPQRSLAIETSQEDFTTFIGPNAEKYLTAFRKLFRKKSAGMHWPAFFVP